MGCPLGPPWRPPWARLWPNGTPRTQGPFLVGFPAGFGGSFCSHFRQISGIFENSFPLRGASGTLQQGLEVAHRRPRRHMAGVPISPCSPFHYPLDNIPHTPCSSLFNYELLSVKVRSLEFLNMLMSTSISRRLQQTSILLETCVHCCTW